MNELQARKAGLAFTGIYCEHENAKQKAYDLRKKGFRAIIISEFGSYRSSVYASKEYFEEEDKQYNKQIFDNISQKIENLKKEYDQKIEELEKLQKDMKEKYNF